MEFCLVGGVESYQDIDTLHWLEAQDRLKLKEQPNGFIPGEGAGFVLLCSRERAQSMGLACAAEIVSTGRGAEQRLCFTGMPNLGEGLTQALQVAFSSEHCPLQQLRAVYSDLNGESWRADEWGYTFVRTGERHASPINMRHPASNWGDIGAASGPALIALASVELNHNLEPHDMVLVWASSDLHPSRSACILRRALRGNS
jgi:3-oxoacyl-[acyl-carrier-protein] synthase-1